MVATPQTAADKSHPAEIDDEWIDEVCERLRNDQRVRRSLPGGGLLNVDRALPFLSVYRRPVSEPDTGTERLVSAESSFLTISADKSLRKSQTRLISRIVAAMSERFGEFLIVEVWSAPNRDVIDATDPAIVEPTELKPTFRIACVSQAARRTVEALESNLRKITCLKQRADVRIDDQLQSRPPGQPVLLTAASVKELNCQIIGIQARPIYRDPETGDVFPAVLQMLRRGMGRALKQTFYTFARTRTSINPRHYYALGRRAIVKAVWDIDRRLAEVSSAFDFLLQVTPVNAQAAWLEFRRSRFLKSPQFYYRPLSVEPMKLKRRLFQVPVEKIEDPTLAHLFRERQDELDRLITMLSDVGTPNFLMGSLQVYGGVEDSLLQVAQQLLADTPARTRGGSAGGQLKAKAFAELAQHEIEYYRERHAGFTARAIIRDDIFTGLMCSGGNLLIGRQTSIPAARAEALLQHEIGTHLLTYYNGVAEPFRQLQFGFAGYDDLQEGLAVVTEHLVGGLSRSRLRILAVRVVAASRMIRGAGFVDLWRMLTEEYGFPQRQSYTIAMRTFRAGGLTKDAVYLRGLIEMLDYLRAGGRMEPLFVGKIATEHIPLIEELTHRHVLHPPPLQPRYLQNPQAIERLEDLRDGRTVLQLAKGTKS